MTVPAVGSNGQCCDKFPVDPDHYTNVIKPHVKLHRSAHAPSFSPAMRTGSIHPSSRGGCQWPRPYCRPPPRDSEGGPPRQGLREDRACLGDRLTLTTLRIPLYTSLLQCGKTPVFWADTNRHAIAVALLRADPRVAAVLARIDWKRARAIASGSARPG